MIRLGVLGLLFLASFNLSLAHAQVPGLGAPAEEVAPSQMLPAASGNHIPGEYAVELADFIASYLVDSNTAPDWAQVRTSDGSLRRISISDAFSLLARTTYLWQALGHLPEYVPIAPSDLRVPVIDSQDVVASADDLSLARQIPTDQFLAQCAPTVQWIDRLRIIPTAVWVDGERLSATEYLAGLAVCIQYAYYQGDLDSYLLLPRYGPPRAWAQSAVGVPIGTSLASLPYLMPAASPGRPSQAETVEEPAAAEGGESGYEFPAPRLALFPEPGSELRGLVNLVAVYEGPPARFVMFYVDGIKRSITNLPPYSCRWDTAEATAGRHSVQVNVLGDDSTVLTTLIGGFTVALEEPETAAVEPSDEL